MRFRKNERKEGRGGHRPVNTEATEKLERAKMRWKKKSTAAVPAHIDLLHRSVLSLSKGERRRGKGGKVGGRVE